MKNIILIIIIMNFARLYPQNTKNHISQKTIQTETDLHYSPKEIVLSKTFELTYPIHEYEAMILRCNELANKLISHKKRIQNGSITKAQLKNLKKDMIEAKLLNYRLGDYTAIYDSQNYPFIEYLSKETLDNYQDFSKALATATQYAEF